MQALSHEEVGKLAQQLYDHGIRQKVEREENIGKMIIIDIESGDYEVDKNGLKAVNRLEERQPNGRFHGLRIGYKVAYSLGGGMERVSLANP
jgi:hypothetical protein